MRTIVAALWMVGCGHDAITMPDAAARDASTPDASGACVAQFSGDFTETATAGSCATITVDGSGDTTLALAIPSTAVPSGVASSFDLGESPAPGTYSSDSITTWSARGVRTLGNGACVYSAGATAVPQGSFAMTVDAIDAATAHGSLSLTLWVLAYPGTDCGADNTEQVQLQF
jgi:hypothetical protein